MILCHSYFMSFEEKPQKSTDLENGERRKLIIEEAQKERLVLSNALASRIIGYVKDHIPKSIQNIASNILNFTVIANFKMGAEAVIGKTSTGEELSPKDRIIYGLIVATSLVGYSLLTHGATTGNRNELEMSAGSFTVSWGLFLSRMGPALIRDTREIAEMQNKTELVAFLTTIEKVLETINYQNIKQLIKNQLN